MKQRKLELKNPVFEGYSFFLVTLESQTSLFLEAETAANLQFETTSGELVTADQINSKHSLWQKLERSAGAYEPVSLVPPGAGLSYKQVFSTGYSGSMQFSAVLLDWGDYQLKLPQYGRLELKHDG